MATNNLEGLVIFRLKGEIHSSVWSTKTFLTKLGNQDISKSKWGIIFQKFLDIGQSDFKISLDCALFQTLEILYTISFCLHLVHNCFCTSDRAMDLTF